MHSLSLLSQFLEGFPRIRRFVVLTYGLLIFKPNYKNKMNIGKFPVYFDKEQNYKVIFDGQCLQNKTINRGIGNYSLKFIQTFCNKFPNFNFCVYLSDIAHRTDIEIAVESLKSLNCPNLYIYIIPVINSKRKINFKKATENLHVRINELKTDVVLTLSPFEKMNSAVPLIHKGPYRRAAILYDLIPYFYEKDLLVSRRNRFIYSLQLGFLKEFDVLFAISLTTRKAWKTLFGDLPTVEAIFGATTTTSIDSWENTELPMRSGILSVVAEQKHKNVFNLLEAYADLSPELRNKNKLILIGIRSIGYKKLVYKKARRLNIKIDILPFVSQAELNNLYQSSRLLVMPSLMEGLSLPIFDGIQNGLLCLGSESTVFEEIVKDPALTFDPYNIKSISKAITSYLVDDVCWMESLQSSKFAISNYSWEQTISLVAIQLGLCDARE